MKNLDQKILLFPLKKRLIPQFGSLSIAPTWNCTHFLKIRLVVDWGGFYCYYIHQGNKSDKERKIVKKLSFIHTKRYNTFLKRWVQFHVYPQLTSFLFTQNKSIFILHNLTYLKLYFSFIYYYYIK